MNHSITCPICLGVFRMSEPESPKKAVQRLLKRARAERLRKDGYSIRAIQKILGYKSPRSVTVLLNSKTI